MSVLVWIRVVALTLAGGSVLVMAEVVLRRVYRTRKERRAAARRKEARDLLLMYLDGEIAEKIALERMAQRPAGAMIEAAVGLLGQLDRSGRSRLRALVRQLDLGAYRAMLRSRRRRGRLRAVHVLTIIGDRGSAPDLRAMLGDPDVHIRLAAAKGLAEQNALPPLAEVIDKLDVVEVGHDRILLSIFRTVAAERSGEVLALVREDMPDIVNVLAIDALGHQGEAALAPRLCAALSSRSLDVRAATLRALSRLGNPQVRVAVRNALVDPAWEVRCQAAVCAGRLRLIEATSELEALLEDEQWWVRFRAAEALLGIGEIGLGILRRVSESPGPAGAIAQTVLHEKVA